MMDRYDIATGNSVTNMRRTPEMIIRKLISCVSRTFLVAPQSDFG